MMTGFGLMSAGIAAAVPRPQEPSELARLLGADLGTVMSTVPGVVCGNRLVNYNSPMPDSPTKCVNGAENSGNFSNVNGSTESNNAIDGSGNIANGSQSLRRGR